MKLEIQKIYPDELDSFIASDLYANLSTKPISPERAISYQFNPRKNPQKAVLFLVLNENSKDIIAFRTVFQDMLFSSMKSFPVAWLSGSWVSEEYRRKGIATEILNSILKEYDGRVLFTNFAPNSLKLYDKSGVFIMFQERGGKKFFIKSFFRFAATKKTRYLALHFIAGALDSIVNFMLNIFSKNTKNSVVLPLNEFNGDVESFLTSCLNSAPTRRLVKEFEWAKNFPWLIQKGEELAYPFSRIDPNFYSQWFILRLNGEIQTVFLINIRNNQLKIPYYFYANHDMHLLCAKHIFSLAKEKNVQSIEVFYPELFQTICKCGFVLHKKNCSNPVYVTESCLEGIDGYFLPGDGEMVFL